MSIIKNLTFRYKLFISYIVIAIIPLLMLGIYSYSQSRLFLVNQAHMNMKEIIQNSSNNISQDFNRYNTIIDFISINARLSGIFNADYSRIYPLYEDITEEVDTTIDSTVMLNHDIEKITIYTSNKDFIKHGSEIDTIDAIKDTQWYDDIESTDIMWHYIDNKIFGVKEMMVQYKTDIQNIVYLEVKTSNILNNLDPNIQNEFDFLIFGNDGELIYISTEDENVNNSAILNEILNSDKDIIKIDGMEHMLIREQIPEPQWDVIFIKPISGITIDTRKIIIATSLITALCFVILILINWFFTYAVTKPIHDLTGKVNLAAKGNFNIKIENSSKDEIGQLSSGIGTLLKSINSLLDEVYYNKLMRKEAELKTLQAQIKPHFLYNTLSFINWNAIKIKAFDISKITITLSKFYRTLLNMGKDLIPIKDEIENLQAYIDIQLMMHDNNFDVFYDIDERIKEYSIMNLTLQPIAENAITHGIEKKEDGRGVIEIRGFIEHGNIVFIIKDNGSGMPPELVRQVFNQKEKGYGIKSVNERIKLFFGDKFGLEITSTVGKGTEIRIKLPKYSF